MEVGVEEVFEVLLLAGFQRGFAELGQDEFVQLAEIRAAFLDGAAVAGADLLVYSNAVPADNPERLAAAVRTAALSISACSARRLSVMSRLKLTTAVTRPSASRTG